MTTEDEAEAIDEFWDVEDRGFCQAGDHHDDHECIHGYMLLTEDTTWAFCDDHEEQALFDIARFALAELTLDEALAAVAREYDDPCNRDVAATIAGHLRRLAAKVP